MTPEELKDRHRAISQVMYECQQRMTILRNELKPLETRFENAWKEKLRLESRMETITFVKPSAARMAAGSSPANVPVGTPESFVRLMQKLPAEQQKALVAELLRIRSHLSG